MAEEKIINEEVKDEEIMIDEELDEVAGGTTKEIKDDANRLRALGYLPQGAVSKHQINDAFLRLGSDYGLKLGYNPSDRDENRYYLDHKKKDHEQIWNIIYSRIGGRY